MKKAISLAVVFMMVFAMLAAGCTKQPAPAQPAEQPAATQPAEAGAAAEPAAAKQFRIGAHTFGSGVYAFDKYKIWQTSVTEALGDDYLFISDEFTADKMPTDVQSLIASDVDGIITQNIFDNTTLAIMNMLQEAEMPFVALEFPADQAIIDTILANPYCCGLTGLYNQEAGKALAERALADGVTSAIIITEPAGSVNGGERADAFKAAFEAGGGTILGHANCSDYTEALAKGEDLYIANQEVDAIFGASSHCMVGAVSILEKYPDAGLKIYGIGLDEDTLNYVRDNSIVAAYCDQWVYVYFATIILEHALHTGEKFVDADGSVPALRTYGVLVTPERADLFEKFFIGNGSPYTTEETLWMVNEATSEEFLAVIQNFSFEERMASLYEKGLITDEEMKAAGLQ